MTQNIYVVPERGLLHLTGEDVKHFLQGLLTNDIETLSPQHNLYAALLTPQGKFLYDFFVYDFEGGVLLEYYKPLREDILKKLTMYRLRSKVQFNDISNTHLVVQAWGDVSGLPDPRNAKLGVRYITTEKPTQHLVTAEHYHAHRIALTIPEMPDDLITGDSFPLPSNMESLHAIDYRKGCYVGQEVTARSKYRGNIRKAIFTVNIKGTAPSAGTVIRSGEQTVGTMLSHAGNIGLAQIDIEIAEKKAALTCGDAILSLT